MNGITLEQVQSGMSVEYGSGDGSLCLCKMSYGKYSLQTALTDGAQETWNKLFRGCRNKDEEEKEIFTPWTSREVTVLYGAGKEIKEQNFKFFLQRAARHADRMFFIPFIAFENGIPFSKIEMRGESFHDLKEKEPPLAQVQITIDPQFDERGEYSQERDTILRLMGVALALRFAQDKKEVYLGEKKWGIVSQVVLHNRRRESFALTEAEKGVAERFELNTTKLENRYKEILICQERILTKMGLTVVDSIGEKENDHRNYESHEQVVFGIVV